MSVNFIKWSDLTSMPLIVKHGHKGHYYKPIAFNFICLKFAKQDKSYKGFLMMPYHAVPSGFSAPEPI